MAEEQYDAKAARRITTVLFVTQSMASAAFIASITVNAIIGAQLSGSDALAGLPTTLMLGGAALSAYPAGRFMQRYGRRPGLSAGFLLGMLGMGLDGLAVAWGSLPLFLAGLVLLGMARGITDQSRYAAADALPLSLRARAISTVVLAGAVGSVGGPLLVGPLGQAAAGVGLPELTGPMAGGTVLFAIGGTILALLLRPDPRTLARQISGAEEAMPAGATDARPAGRSVAAALRAPAARTALIAMVAGQAVMVLVMSVTSLHMHHHQHGLDTISLVIGAHTLGMFGLSVFTGLLADRLGRPLVVALGALLLIAGALLAPLSLLTPWLALALFLVGLGWNFCYIGGSSLLADSLAPAERGQVQGGADLLVNLSSAGGSLISGVLLAGPGYGTLCLLGAAVSLIPLGAAALNVRARRAALAGD